MTYKRHYLYFEMIKTFYLQLVCLFAQRSLCVFSDNFFFFYIYKTIITLYIYAIISNTYLCVC